MWGLYRCGNCNFRYFWKQKLVDGSSFYQACTSLTKSNNFPYKLKMPPVLPPKPLGIFLGCRTAQTMVDVFVDPCCPFSKKIFIKLLEVHEWAESTAPSKLCVRVFLYPQPWHPQSTMLVEAAVAVQRTDETQVIPFLVKLFETVTDFYDASTYSKSRQEIYQELSEIAKDFIPQELFLEQLQFQVIEGQKNSGNLCTQDIKWLVKYGRACGVHVTPTCFLNNIEAGHISSGWELSEWQGLLAPHLA